MRQLSLSTVLMLLSVPTHAQNVQHDFKLDTPPVPGQIQEAPRDELRPGANRQRGFHSEDFGLPSSGPKGGVERVGEIPHEGDQVPLRRP